jgi:hypothetical protein
MPASMKKKLIWQRKQSLVREIWSAQAPKDMFVTGRPRPTGLAGWHLFENCQVCRSAKYWRGELLSHFRPLLAMAEWDFSIRPAPLPFGKNRQKWPTNRPPGNPAGRTPKVMSPAGMSKVMSAG